jgi:hypothetical protein
MQMSQCFTSFFAGRTWAKVWKSWTGCGGGNWYGGLSIIARSGFWGGRVAEGEEETKTKAEADSLRE